MTPAGGVTVVVELTPPGRAAVAVVLVAGPDAGRAVGKSFTPRSGRPAAQIPAGQIALGRWGGADGEELIVCRRGDELIEIHCHGGTAAVEAVINRLENKGCKRIAWQDWVRRSSIDGIRAAAQCALANAATMRTAAILMDQFNGALSEAIREIIAAISAAEWSSAAKKIDELISRREFGLHLVKPWRVVVFGPPNVGKSSLINALAGYERAIVSPMPGTTRDVVIVTTAIDGWPVQLTDTAGLRTTEDELESAGIELATASLLEADLAVLVYDVQKPNHLSIYDEIKCVVPKIRSMRTIHAINKLDLLPLAERSDLQIRPTAIRLENSCLNFVSARTGEGLDGLATAIGRLLVPIALPAGTAVPFTLGQIDSLAAASTAIVRRDAPAATDVLQAMLTD